MKSDKHLVYECILGRATCLGCLLPLVIVSCLLGKSQVIIHLERWRKGYRDYVRPSDFPSSLGFPWYKEIKTISKYFPFVSKNSNKWYDTSGFKENFSLEKYILCLQIPFINLVEINNCDKNVSTFFLKLIPLNRKAGWILVMQNIILNSEEC